VRIPWASVPALVVSLVIGASCFSALGLAITAIIPNADASPAVVNAVVFPLLFVSNVFIPIAHPPAFLHTVTGIFPVGRLAAALQQAFFPGPHSSSLAATPLLIMAAWGIAGLIVALRFFSWEPRQQPG
jgi:ABC-2 type transport system permease protein